MMKKLLSTLERLRPPTPVSSRPSSPTEGQSPSASDRERTTDEELTPQSPFSQQQSSQRPLPFREHSSSSIVTAGSFNQGHKRISPRTSLNGTRKSMSGIRLLPAPTQLEVLRYRYHHGVSIDGIFVMKRELCSDIFSVNGTSSEQEYDAVGAYLKKHGLPATRARCDKHWKEFLTSEGWEWLVDVGVTSVRINVGWHSFGTAWCEGTPFEPTKEVYINSYAHLKSFISAARKQDIGVLLNLQAPYLQAQHGLIKPWESSKYRTLFHKLIQYICQQITSSAILKEAIIGLQFVEESQLPLTDSVAKDFYDWYDEVMDIIQSINPQLPVYIPTSTSREVTSVFDPMYGKPKNEEFMPRRSAMWSPSVDYDNQRNPIFSITSIAKSIRGEPNALTMRNEFDEAAFDEGTDYSGCMIGALAGSIRNSLEQEQSLQLSLRRKSLGAQDANIMKHNGVHSLGGYFWDLKMASLKQLNHGGEGIEPSLVLPPAPSNLNLPLDFITTLRTMALSKKTSLKSSAVTAYKKSLNRNSSSFEVGHQIVAAAEDEIARDALLYNYAEGWELGFTDALTFWGGDCVAGNCGGGDTIGRIDNWLGKRVWKEYAELVLGGGLMEVNKNEVDTEQQAEVEVERRRGLKVLNVFEKAMGDGILEFETTVGIGVKIGRLGAGRRESR